MSRRAVDWVTWMRPTYPADKLVLFALADAANDKTLTAYPSIKAIVAFTGLERKRVIGSLARLSATGLILDTGERVGRTKQVKVWRVNAVAGRVPWRDPFGAAFSE